MKQTKLMSLMEAATNTAIGYVLSCLVWVFVVAPLYHIPVRIGETLGITAIFTVSSIIKGYLLRRYFNGFNKRGASPDGTDG